MKLVDWANNVWKHELDEPSDVSLSSVTAWARANYGKINTLLNINLALNSSYDLVNSDDGIEMTEEIGAIFAKIYLLSYYSRQIRAFSGAGGINYVSSISQDGLTTKFVERTGASKIFLEMKKNTQEELKQLLNNFKFNRALPSHIRGDDFISKYDVDTTE